MAEPSARRGRTPAAASPGLPAASPAAYCRPHSIRSGETGARIRAPPGPGRALTARAHLHPLLLSSLQGQAIWIPDERRGFVKGTAVTSFLAGEEGEITLPSGEVSKCPPGRARPRLRPSDGRRGFVDALMNHEITQFVESTTNQRTACPLANQYEHGEVSKSATPSRPCRVLPLTCGHLLRVLLYRLARSS